MFYQRFSEYHYKRTLRKEKIKFITFVIGSIVFVIGVILICITF